jgi:hypothetical protein
VVGDWNGDGRTDVGFIHNWGWGWGWYLDGNGNGVWDGCSVDRCFFFGKKGGGRHAFLAPLPEANGYWARYSTDGPTFVRAFRRIRQVFARRGVPAESVRWVFAPNGWHEPDKPWKAFEYYYPGDADTDVVGFSSYNFGGCPEDTPWRNWDTFETAMRPYLDRMRAMAPSKPIFIAQTGTVGVPDDPADPNQNKSTWVYDTFSRLADYPGVKVILPGTGPSGLA